MSSSRIIAGRSVEECRCRPFEVFQAEEEENPEGRARTEDFVFPNLTADGETRAPSEGLPEQERLPSPAEAARAESEEILQRAREEAEQLREQARQEGRARGQEEASREMEGRLGAAIEAFRKAGDEVLHLRRQLVERQEKEMVELALAIARKVIHREITQDPETTQSIVKAILQETVDREEILVRLNPEDHEAALKCRAELMASADGIRKLSIERDPNVPRGGVLVESRSGEMDGRIEQQLEEVEQGLRTQFYRRRRTD